MPVIFPEGVTAQGNVKVAFCTRAGIADPTAPKVTELTAASVVDASFILQEGNWTPSAEASRGSAPRRLGAKKNFESFGATTESLADLVYVVDPQAEDTEDAKKLYALLVEGGDFYAVETETVEFALDQYVNIHPIKVGPRPITGDTSDEFAEFIVTQPVAIEAPGVYRDVKIVAGP